MDTNSSSLPPSPPLDQGWQSDQPISNCILTVFESQILTDISFLCKDQDKENPDDRIHAHKNILAAHSPVFRAMFSGFYQNEEKNISLSDIEGKDFKVFLRSIYSDELSSEVEHLVQTLKIAHKYQANYVVDRCFTELSENLTTENACSLLDLALFYENERLKKSACKEIDRNADDILESKGFMDISLQCLTYILKGDTFFTDETEIFKQSIQWARKRCNSSDGNCLRNTLGEAFFYLRTPAMTLKEFISCTNRKGYYTLQETEDIIEAIANKDDEEYDNILCHSRVSRIPPKINVQLFEKQYGSSHYTPSATLSLKLMPNVDVFLVEIQFSSLHNGGIRNRSYSTYDASGRQLMATVMIEEIDVCEDYFFIAKNPSVKLRLKKPILLQASDIGYYLRLELQPVNMQFIELQVKQHNTSKEVEDDFGIIRIRSSSSCHAIVDSLTFEQVSHRED